MSTVVTLVAFAANSVLCRFALGNDKIDAASFTVIRLLSGSLALFFLIQINSNKHNSIHKGNWYSSAMLFLYAAAFSFAYITLDTGTGALILFGSVQVTMILLSLKRGNYLHISEWMGVIIDLCGFVYLVLPGIKAPPIIGFILMTLSGIGWGIYTLNGRNSKTPLIDTAYNFIKTIPFVIILFLVSIPYINYSTQGIILAAASGSITSGLGYAIWYYALGGLTDTQAAVVQLLVPVIAALGGIIFISEEPSFRLFLSSLLILGGIFLVILGKYYFVKNNLIEKI